MKKRYYIIGLMIPIILLLLGGFACSKPSSAQTNSPIDLGITEIRKYEGKDLSSINDFRENSIAGPQKVDISTYKLKIDGLVDKKLDYSYDSILGDFTKYKKVVELDCVEGWNVKLLWEGILVTDLLKNAAVKAAANTVIFHAADGYTTSLPLDFIQKNNIMLAYKMNDVVLPVDRGYPLQLVAESKWGYKWIKWVTEIELSSDPNYRGYWESRGYSNNGDLQGDIFENVK
jgi:DMSO/TMAO reductase YedYZ molybdopterin-dependent catalytic subunit